MATEHSHSSECPIDAQLSAIDDNPIGYLSTNYQVPLNYFLCRIGETPGDPMMAGDRPEAQLVKNANNVKYKSNGK